MLRMRRHYILSAPGCFQMENRFFWDLFPKFFGFKKFLLRPYFYVSPTLKTITAMSNTDYPAQYTIPVRDLDEDWFREQD